MLRAILLSLTPPFTLSCGGWAALQRLSQLNFAQIYTSTVRDLPQAVPQTLPQAVSQSISATYSQAVPQAVFRRLIQKQGA